MARKLTKEELERYKCDFDPPPGAKRRAKKTKADETAAKQQRDQLSLFEREKQGRGRPSKYNEETRTVTFRLPISIIKKLRVFSALNDRTPGDVLTELIKPLNVPGCK